MQQFIVQAMGPSVAFAKSSMADTSAMISKAAMTTSKPAKSIKTTVLTGEEFLSYDEVVRPQIVYWPEDAVIEVGQINRLVAAFIEDYAREPQRSHWQKLKKVCNKGF